MNIDKSFFRIDIFRFAMDNTLKNNLSEYLLSTISNMLAMHYASDAKLQNEDIQKYAYGASYKIKLYVTEKVLVDETFDVAMELFIIAISASMPNREDLINNKAPIVEMVSNLSYPDGDISKSEKANLSETIEGVLKEDISVMNIMKDEPQILKSLLQKNTKPKDIISILQRASHSQKVQSNITQDFAQSAGLALCSVAGFAANFAIASYIGAISAVAIVPATIIAVKYGAEIGENIGKVMSSFEKEFVKQSENITNIVKDFIPTLTKTSIEKAKTNEVDKSNEMLNAVKQDIEKHRASQKEIATIKVPLKKREKSMVKNVI